MGKEEDMAVENCDDEGGGCEEQRCMRVCEEVRSELW